MTFRPNPPRMITVVIAVALLVIGVAGTLLPAATIRDVVTGLPLPKDIDREVLRLALDNTIAYVFALAAPMLLVVGSLLPGI
jgi:hypothetical protein